MSHLRERHRHVFEVTVWAKQTHDNRDLEYIMLKRDLERWAEEDLGDGSEPIELGEMSCEMVAKELIQYLRDEYDEVRAYKAEVLEDGENGALVEAKSTDQVDIIEK